jgi:hypothetical protein
MKKLLLVMAFAALSFTAFSKTTDTDKNQPTEKKEAPKKDNSQKRGFDCFPVQMNLSCTTLFGTMCVDSGMSPVDRQQAFEQDTDSAESIYCG